jgi:hypothetical protein
MFGFCGLPAVDATHGYVVRALQGKTTRAFGASPSRRSLVSLRLIIWRVSQRILEQEAGRGEAREKGTVRIGEGRVPDRTNGHHPERCHLFLAMSSPIRDR